MGVELGHSPPRGPGPLTLSDESKGRAGGGPRLPFRHACLSPLHALTCHSEATRGIYSASPPLTPCRTLHPDSSFRPPRAGIHPWGGVSRSRRGDRLVALPSAGPLTSSRVEESQERNLVGYLPPPPPLTPISTTKETRKQASLELGELSADFCAHYSDFLARVRLTDFCA